MNDLIPSVPLGSILKNSTLSTEYIYVLRMDIRTKIGYFPIQNLLTDIGNHICSLYRNAISKSDHSTASINWMIRMSYELKIM